MALGTTVQAGNKKGSTGAATNLLQHSAQWFTMIDVGGADDTDNSGSAITDPTTQITASTRKLIATSGAGTLLLIRMMYVAADTITTNPVVQVFGRSSDTEGWMALRNKANSHEITLDAVEASDVDTTIGATPYSSTAVDLDDHYIDLAGCSQILMGIKTAAAGAAVSLAWIEGKII